MTILIADDDRATRMLVSDMVKSWGYDTIEAASGDEAWVVVNGESPPEMAILDWVMPGMSGVDVCQRWQERGNPHLMYMVLLTCKDGHDDKVHALGCGAHDFLTKPVIPDELRARIAVGCRLVEMDRLKNSWLGMAAHDLRSPLTIINMFVKLMLNRRFGPVPEQQHEMLEMCGSAIERMRLLIDDFLDLSAISAGKLRLDLERGPLRPVIERHVALMAPVAADAGVRLEVALDDVPEVEYDGHRLGQVVDNLTNNAIKFSPAGSTVRVSLGRSGERVVVAVADQGPGLSEADRRRLFGEFNRLSTQSPGNERRTGLGLAIARRIVSEHGGTLTVESEVGQGATFRVSLPLAETAEGARPGCLTLRGARARG